MTIDTGTSEPVSQKPYLIAMEHYQWVKDEINTFLTAKVIWGGWSCWSAPITVVPNGDGRWKKTSSYWLPCTQLGHTEIYLAYAKSRVYFSQLNRAKYFSTLDLWVGYHYIPLDELSIPRTAFTSLYGKYKYTKVPFELMQASAYLQELMTGVLKDFSFAITYLDNIIIFSRTAEEHLSHIKQVLKNWGMHIYWWSLANVISSQRKSSTLDIFSAPNASDLYHQNPSHKQHASTKNSQASTCIPWTHWIL